jgi:type III restriction enzyme
MGVSHGFFPDFIVKLMNGVNLILEVKGLINEKEKAKFEAAKRWCHAVNNWGKMGTWQFHVARDPDQLQKELRFLNAQSEVNMEPLSTI